MHDRYNHAVSKNNGRPITEERPSVYHYSAVIHAFARSGDAENARALLQRIEADPEIHPNLKCYHGFMLALMNPVGQQPSPASEVEMVLRRLYHPSSKIRPTPLLVATAIDAWQQHGRDESDAVSRSTAILEEYVQDFPRSAHRGNSPEHAMLLPFLSYFRVISFSSVLSAEKRKTHAEKALAWIRKLGLQPSRAILKEVDACGISSHDDVHFQGERGGPVHN